MSQIRTNSVVPASGLKAGALSGGVIQVYQDTQLAVETTTSTSLVDTALSITLTPVSGNSRFVIYSSVNISNNSNNTAYWSLVRGTTQIYRSNTTGVTQATGCSGTGAGTYNSSEQFDVRSNVFVDSPATTSSITYKIQYASLSGTTLLNRRATNQSVNVPSSLIILEVAS